MSNAVGADSFVRHVKKRSVDAAELSRDIDHDGGALVKRLRAASLQSSHDANTLPPRREGCDMYASASSFIPRDCQTEATVVIDRPARTESHTHGQLYRTTKHLIRSSPDQWTGACFPQYFDRRAVPWLDFVYGECARVGRIVAEGHVHAIMSGSLDFLAITIALEQDFALWISICRRQSEQSRDAGLVSFVDTLARTWMFLMSGLVAGKCLDEFNVTGAWRVLRTLREKLSNVYDNAFHQTIELLEMHTDVPYKMSDV
eukprot:m.233631 g.233631  ORF g.233631 m.233631 type:complete len:259 (-) comp19299_c0_seq1:659-1435(-)